MVDPCGFPHSPMLVNLPGMYLACWARITLYSSLVKRSIPMVLRKISALSASGK